MPPLPRPGPQLVRWFTPGLNIKRWLLLLFASVVMISLAVGYAMKDAYQTFTFPAFAGPLTLEFLPRWVRALVFAVIGIGVLVLSFYKLGQSLLGPFLLGRNGNGDRALVEQLYAHRLLTKGPRLVTMGGGTGMSAMLRGIKRYTGNISAIVTVADDGGSSRRLRGEFRVLPPGDVRQCLTALAEPDPPLTSLFNHRFTGEGSLGGHSFGNLFTMAMVEITGNFEHAL